MKQEANRLFYGEALPQFEKLLANQEYLLGGREFTIIDIVYFNQLMTVESLNFDQIKSEEFPNTVAWITRLREVEELDEQLEKLIDQINQYNLLVAK